MKTSGRHETDQGGIAPGTVTSVAAQVRRPNRVSVHLDGQYAFSLPADLAVLHGLRKGLVIDEAAAQALIRDLAMHDAKHRALSLLASRPRSTAEIRRALERRAVDASIIEQVIDRLIELGYLDDAAFARNYAIARSRAKGYGPRRIQAELRRRGVAADDVRLAIQEALGEDDPFDAALAAAEKVWPRYAREPDRRRRTARMYAYLARRGFESSTISSVLRRLDDEAP